MKKKMCFSILFAVSTAALLVFGGVGTVRAKSGCSNATLRGSYGLHATGTFTGGPNIGPAAFDGVITFDGMGQLELSLTQRLNTAGGPITLTRVPLVGTYTVNSDCTADDVWQNLSTGTSTTHELVMVENGRGFFILNTTTGAPNVVSGVGRKQFVDERGD